MTTVSQTGLARFREQLSECWRRLPNKWFFLGLCAAWLALFHFLGHCSFNFTKSPSILAWMWGAYSAPALDSEHGKLILPAVAILLWLKRDELISVASHVWWPAVIGLFIALLVHIAGYAIQQPRVSMVAFFAGLYCLIALAWGTRFARACLFPFALFVFAIPLGNTIQGLTVPLRLFATTITRIVASGLGIPLIQHGNQLLDPSGTYGYEIVAACSGIRSLIPVIAITWIYAVLSLQSNGKRILLVGFAIPLAVLCNILRVLAIVIVREVLDEHAATLVHEYFGFVTYSLTLAGAFLLAAYLQRSKTQNSDTVERQVPA